MGESRAAERGKERLRDSRNTQRQARTNRDTDGLRKKKVQKHGEISRLNGGHHAKQMHVQKEKSTLKTYAGRQLKKGIYLCAYAEKTYVQGSKLNNDKFKA